jgi:hypothetical protein
LWFLSWGKDRQFGLNSQPSRTKLPEPPYHQCASALDLVNSMGGFLPDPFLFGDAMLQIIPPKYHGSFDRVVNIYKVPGLSRSIQLLRY